MNRTHRRKSIRRLRVFASAACHLRGHQLSEAHARRRPPAELPESRPRLVIDRDPSHARTRIAGRVALRQPDSPLSGCLRGLALGSAPTSHGCSVTVYAPWCRCVPGLFGVVVVLVVTSWEPRPGSYSCRLDRLVWCVLGSLGLLRGERCHGSVVALVLRLELAPAIGPGPTGRRGSRTPPAAGGSPQPLRSSHTRRQGRNRSRHHAPSAVRLK
jgi:hypothetical protein